MEKINYRQLALITCFLLFSTKIFSLPALMFSVAENSSWIAILVGMLIDTVFIYSILYLLRTSEEKNFYEFLKKRVGNVPARIICFLFAAYSIITIANLMKSMTIFLMQNLYEEFSWLNIVLPLFAVCGFVAYKGVRNIGRLCEIFIPLIVIGVIALVLISYKKIDLTYIFPVLKDGIKPIFEGIFRHAGWFGGGCLLFLLFGKVDLTTHKKWLVTKYVILSFLIIQIIIIIFYCMFQFNSGIHWFAISDITQYSTKNAALDELQWALVMIWMFTQMIEVCLYAYLASNGLRYCFGFKSAKIPILFIFTLISAFLYFFCKDLKIAELFYSDWSSAIALGLQYGLPLLIFIADLIFKIRRRRHLKRIKDGPKTKQLEIEEFLDNEQSADGQTADESQTIGEAQQLMQQLQQDEKKPQMGSGGKAEVL